MQLASRIRGSKVIIDWHNTGYSVLALRLGRNSPIVRIAKGYVTARSPLLMKGLIDMFTRIHRIETLCGRVAYAHLCVTAAMKSDLLRDAKLK